MAQSLGVVTSPAEIEEAQADQRKGFIEFFGGPEVTVRSFELDDTLQRFEEYLLSVRRRRQDAINAESDAPPRPARGHIAVRRVRRNRGPAKIFGLPAHI